MANAYFAWWLYFERFGDWIQSPMARFAKFVLLVKVSGFMVPYVLLNALIT